MARRKGGSASSGGASCGGLTHCPAATSYTSPIVLAHLRVSHGWQRQHLDTAPSACAALPTCREQPTHPTRAPVVAAAAAAPVKPKRGELAALREGSMLSAPWDPASPPAPPDRHAAVMNRPAGAAVLGLVRCPGEPLSPSWSPSTPPPSTSECMLLVALCCPVRALSCAADDASPPAEHVTDPCELATRQSSLTCGARRDPVSSSRA